MRESHGGDEIHQPVHGHVLGLSQWSVAFCFHLAQGNEKAWELILAALTETSGTCGCKFRQNLVCGWLTARAEEVALLD